MCTAIELYQLLCDDFFRVGSSHKWVKSITSIVGPLTGSTLMHMLGVQPNSTVSFGSVNHIVTASCSTLWKFQQIFPKLKNLYDLRMPQWKNHSSWKNVLSNKAAPIQSGDLGISIIAMN